MVAKITAYLDKQSRISIVSWAMALVALIGLLDFATGYEVRVGIFYVAPVFIAAWYAGRLCGIIVAIVSGIAILMTDIAGGLSFSHPAIFIWNTGAFMGFLIVLVIVVVKLRLAREALESLIQTVAHDLKSPAITVVGLVRALKGRCRSLPADERRDRILDQLESSGQTMENFLKELLDGLVSDHIEPVCDRVHLDQIVRESVQQHHQTIEERGIDAQLEIASDIAPVWADPHCIRRVIDNILLNAIRHMGDRADPMIKIEVRDHPEGILTRISDNGIGIPAQDLLKIFDRFFRVRRQGAQAGTGLGLYSAKQIIDSHGGRIWAESELGSGTAFSFTLPELNPQKRGGTCYSNRTISER